VRLLEAGRHGTIPLERRWPHLPAGADAMAVLQGARIQAATPKAGNNFAHTLRDKSRLEMVEWCGFREVAASQSKMTCDLDSTERAVFCGLRQLTFRSLAQAQWTYSGSVTLPSSGACQSNGPIIFMGYD